MHQVDTCPQNCLEKLRSEASLLLREGLSLLLNVLKFLLRVPKLLLLSGLFDHCAVLILTILRNLVIHSPSDSAELHDFINTPTSGRLYPQHVVEMLRAISTAEWNSKEVAFKLISTTVKLGNRANGTGMVQMTCDENINFVPYVHPMFSSPPLAESEAHNSAQLDQSVQTVLADCPSEACVFSGTREQYEDIAGDDDILLLNLGYCYACNLQVAMPHVQQHLVAMEHQNKVQMLLEYYNMEKECFQLHDLLLGCIRRLQDDNHSENQSAKLICTMEKQAKQNNSIFDSNRWQSSWEGGIPQLKLMKERMESLLLL